jgi:hypothetical protein
VCERLNVDRDHWKDGREREPKATPRVNADDARAKVDSARKQWSYAKPARGTIVETYLKVRGIELEEFFPNTIRFLPAWKDRPPAMLAPFAMAYETAPGVLAVRPDEITGLHRTYLKNDGSGRLDKKMLGTCKGTPIVLAPPNDSLGLAISEGIEDGLNCFAATGLGVWAAGAAGFMPALADRIPNYIEAVTILAHPEKAGQDGANELAERLRPRGIWIEIHEVARND